QEKAAYAAATSTYKQHITPPVDKDALDIIKQLYEELYSSDELSLSSTSERVAFADVVEQIIHLYAPVARYKEFLEKGGLARLRDELAIRIKLYSQDLKKNLAEEGLSHDQQPHHLIEINPDTMYELPEATGLIRLPITPPLFNDHLNELSNSDSQNQTTNQDSAESFYIQLPRVVDLSFWSPPVKDQGQRNACTIYAIAAMVEYFQYRTSGIRPRGTSVRFLYSVVHRMNQQLGQDISKGTSIRQTLRALMLFGIPPQEYWPEESDTPPENARTTNPDPFTVEPPAFCYAFAQNFQTTQYFRLDYLYGAYLDKQKNKDYKPKSSGPKMASFYPSRKKGPEEEIEVDSKQLLLTTLIQIKAALVAGFPSVFGFPCNDELADLVNAGDGNIKVPSNQLVQKLTKAFNTEGFEGHAVLAIGYDDLHPVSYQDSDDSGEGAFLIQNSWREDWGTQGYGWLPYDYVLKGLTRDWWSLLSTEWVETGIFGLSNRFGGGRPQQTSTGG
ncbi:hypothetical protein C7271_17370, partial [filamentous cyanobacterium CCP5]